MAFTCPIKSEPSYIALKSVIGEKGAIEYFKRNDELIETDIRDVNLTKHFTYRETAEYGIKNFNEFLEKNKEQDKKKLTASANSRLRTLNLLVGAPIFSWNVEGDTLSEEKIPQSFLQVNYSLIKAVDDGDLSAYLEDTVSPDELEEQTETLAQRLRKFNIPLTPQVLGAYDYLDIVEKLITDPDSKSKKPGELKFLKEQLELFKSIVPKLENRSIKFALDHVDNPKEMTSGVFVQAARIERLYTSLGIKNEAFQNILTPGEKRRFEIMNQQQGGPAYIGINPSLFLYENSQTAASVMLHELTHSIVFRQFNTEKFRAELMGISDRNLTIEFRDEIFNPIYKTMLEILTIKKQMKSAAGDLSKEAAVAQVRAEMYGMTNLDEFIAEFASNFTFMNAVLNEIRNSTLVEKNSQLTEALQKLYERVATLSEQVIESTFGAEKGKELLSYFRNFFNDTQKFYSYEKFAADVDFESVQDPMVVIARHLASDQEDLEDQLKEYASTIDLVDRVISRMAVLYTKLESRAESPEDKAELVKIKNQLKILKKVKNKGEAIQALTNFVHFVASEAEKGVNQVIKLKEAGELNIYNIRKINHESFELIKQIEEEFDTIGIDNFSLITFEKVPGQTRPVKKVKKYSLEDFSREVIGPVKTNLDWLTSQYKKTAFSHAVDKLYEQNTIEGFTKDDLAESLKFMSEDITFTQRFLNSIADSPDPVLALVDRLVSRKRSEVQRLVSDFQNNKLVPILETLIEHRKKKGITTANAEKFYDFMLERNKSGKLTGNIIGVDSAKAKALDKVEKDFLNFYTEEYFKAQNAYPSGYKRGRQLIPIWKSNLDRVIEKQGLKKQGKNIVEGVLTRRSEDLDYATYTDESGKTVKFLPVRFTESLRTASEVAAKENEGAPTVEDVSLDLASNLLQFKTSADNYSKMKKVIVDLEAILYTVGERKVGQQIGGRSLVEKVSKKFKGYFHSKDSKPQTKPGKYSNAYSRLEKYINTVVYGEYDVYLGTVGKTSIDTGKLLKLIKNTASVNVLAFNLFSGINNSLIGNISNAIEAMSGEFYKMKDFIAAKKEYYSGDVMTEMLKDYMSGFRKNKLNIWMEDWDLFQEFDEAGNKLDYRNRKLRYVSDVDFFMQNAGEHAIQTQLAIAMAKHHRILNDKIYSLDKYLEANPNKSEKDFEKLPNVYDSLVFKEGTKTVTTSVKITNKKTFDKEMFDFTQRIQQVYQSLHGNYLKKDKTPLETYAWGQLISQFRRWLKPGWDRRWAKSKFGGKDTMNFRLGTKQAGYYTVTYEFVEEMFKEMKRKKFQHVKQIMTGEWNKMPLWKKRAIKRTLIEQGIITALLTTIIPLVQAIDYDDDDILGEMLDMVEYQAHRVYAELMFFSPIGLAGGEAFQILRSPAAALSYTEKSAKFFKQLVASPTEVYETGRYKGQVKSLKYLKDLFPYIHQIERWGKADEALTYFK